MPQKQEEKVVALRRDVLSNLKLRNTDVTEELVETFRTFLEKTDNTRDVVKTLKPKKRTSLALEFINERHPKSRNNRLYFWPVAIDQLSENAILEQLSDLMCLDAGKIPRSRTEAEQPSTPAIQTRPVEPQDIPQHASQSSLQEPELLAKRANDRNEEKDPDYTEPASDYVLDTSRETRRVSKNLSTSPPKQLPSPMGVASTRRKPTGPPAGRAPQPHSNSIFNAPKVSHARSSSSGQIRTPPPSAKKLGKRPATGIAYDEDADMFVSGSSLETGMNWEDPSLAGPSGIWSTVETDLHPVSSHYAGPSRKRVRYEGPAQVSGLSESIAAARIPSPPVFATGSSAQLQPALDLSVDNVRKFDQAAEGLVSANRADPAAAAVSPSRMNFDSFYPPSPKPTADVGVQCQHDVAIGDRIVIDFQGLQHAQLYDLPSTFLDQLAECRRSHEMNGTNESRVRAAVLRDVEQQLRNSLGGP